MKSAFVIGSGIAGLSIAEILSRNGYKVTILESQDKIGGEASLATQKWYHTGWLYAPLLNKAAMMGCYKALQLYDPALRGALKVAGFLTRDSRVVERKKYGKAKARKSFQFSKR